MFGFMGGPCRSCSSDQEQSIYRSFFCGLSGALRQDYSPAARFLVNRDSTFLSLMTAAAGPQEPVASMSTCCNPISVPRPLFQSGLHSRYAAAVAMCGLATKLNDDREDEKGLRKLVSGVFGKTLTPLTDRAVSFLNTVHFPTAKVVDLMASQESVEAGKPDLIQAAAPTAAAYGTIFEHGAKLEGASHRAKEFQGLGQRLGQLIYWKDAHDDLEADTRRGRFNPLHYNSRAEFDDLFNRTGQEFHQASLTATGGNFKELIGQILASTIHRHQPLLTMPQAEQSPYKLADKQQNELDDPPKSSRKKCCEFSENFCCFADIGCHGCAICSCLG